MIRHRGDDKSHLSLTLEEVEKLENTISSQVASISLLEDTISMLKKYPSLSVERSPLLLTCQGIVWRKKMEYPFIQSHSTNPGGY